MSWNVNVAVSFIVLSKTCNGGGDMEISPIRQGQSVGMATVFSLRDVWSGVLSLDYTTYLLR